LRSGSCRGESDTKHTTAAAASLTKQMVRYTKLSTESCRWEWQVRSFLAALAHPSRPAPPPVDLQPPPWQPRRQPRLRRRSGRCCCFAGPFCLLGGALLGCLQLHVGEAIVSAEAAGEAVSPVSVVLALAVSRTVAHQRGPLLWSLSVHVLYSTLVRKRKN
jgi:hypothetical protein